MKHFIPLIVFYLCITFLFSCKKDNTAYTFAGNSAPFIAMPSDGLGYFSAVKVITSEDYNLPQTSVCLPNSKTKMLTIANNSASQITIGTACFLPAGSPGISASYDGHNMPVSAGGGCIINEFLSGPSDTIIFNSFTSWAFVLSGSATDTLQYAFTDNIALPSIADINTNGTVSTQGSYTLSSVGNVSGDSVIFIIKGPNATLNTTLGANAASCTFSAVQMATLGATGGNKYGLLQIVPYRISPQTINGNKLYVLKEVCLSKYVALQ